MRRQSLLGCKMEGPVQVKKNSNRNSKRLPEHFGPLCFNSCLVYGKCSFVCWTAPTPPTSSSIVFSMSTTQGSELERCSLTNFPQRHLYPVSKLGNALRLEGHSVMDSSHKQFRIRPGFRMGPRRSSHPL